MFHVWKTCYYINSYVTTFSFKEMRRFAGHSKWANIRHIKGLKDGQKSATFAKMGRLIRVAIQEGKNADPNSNTQLAQVMDQAKRCNMPLASIQNAIKQCKDSKTETKSGIVELKGPSGSAIIVNLLTDNYAKTKQTLNTIVRKSKMQFSAGGWQHLFSYKGVIEAELQDSSLEQALSHALEVGLEDVVEINNNDVKLVQFICGPEQLHTISKQLEELKYVIRSADYEYIPNTHVVLRESDLESINYLYEKLQDHPDVVSVYDNIMWDP